jgi:hypothetical protein
MTFFGTPDAKVKGIFGGRYSLWISMTGSAAYAITKYGLKSV